MRLIPSDPDVETIVRRIDDGSLDLQPDFQRGEVWSRPKQRLLVDSILRDWYVPPVHLVRVEGAKQVVLDGQQRLRAIYGFVHNEFPTDGKSDPYEATIAATGDLRYDALPPDVRRQFDRFTLRQFELVDYSAEEPYELFFRLNQPTTLTEAEKRNAFFGEAREQVRTLANEAELFGMTSQRLGFSNARLAHEDLVARLIWTLEARSLGEKVTASRITARYRSLEPFTKGAVELSRAALKELFALEALADPRVRLNKATAYSWLVFVGRALMNQEPLAHLNEFLQYVEQTRTWTKDSVEPTSAAAIADGSGQLFAVLNDRAAARVNDVSSVVLRDVILWTLYGSKSRSLKPAIARFSRVAKGAATTRDVENGLLERAALEGWELLR